MLSASLLTDISQADFTLRDGFVDGTIAYSGSYPSNGDTLDLSQARIGNLRVTARPAPLSFPNLNPDTKL